MNIKSVYLNFRHFREKSIRFSPLFFLPLIFLIFFSCSQSDESALLKRSRGSLSNLLQELQGIGKREEALERRNTLETRFEEVAETAIALKEKGLILGEVLLKEDDTVSVQKKILMELERIYQIDGCPEIIEKAEEAALFKLDLHEHEREVKLRKKERQL